MSATGVSLDLLRELRAICGDEHVLEPEKTTALVASPGSADEVAAIVRLANQHGFSIAPTGGHADADSAAKADVLLRMHRLSEVEHYDPADLTVGIGAGMTVAELNALVAGGKLMFACDPAFPELATVGGVLAAAKHGPLRQGFGGVRDYCIGIRFVTGDGRKAKGGGRVVKNVAGYDMMKLLIGSYGTLAVITSASFKLFPAPRRTRTFLAEFATWQEALKFRDQVVRSPLSPMCLEIVSPLARKMMRPEMTHDAWVICIRAAGSDAVLARYHKELGTAITREVDGADELELWRALENFPFSSGDQAQVQAQLRISAMHPVDMMIPPSSLPRVIEAADALNSSEMSDVACGFIGRIGIGHLRLVAWPQGETLWKGIAHELPKRLPDASNLVMARAQNPWPVQPANIDSMHAVKQALDPNNVLRGRELF